MNKRGIRIAAICGIIHFSLSFLTDRLVFNPITENNIGLWIFAKCLYFAMVMILWWFGYKVVSSARCRRILYNSIPNLILIIIGIWAIFPGIQFNGDIPYFFNNAINYNYSGGLHWISTMFYIVAMMLIPSYAGPTILMGIMSSLLAGSIITLFEPLVKNTIWLRIAFLLPVYIFYGLYPNRLPMVTNVMVLFWALLFYEYTKGKQSTGYHACLLILAGILSVWRIELLSLIVMAPVLILFAQRNKFQWKKYAIYFGIILCVHIVFTVPDKVANQEDSIWGKLYPFFNYTLPTMELSGMNIEDYKDEYDVINQYLDLPKLHVSMEEDGEYYWKSPRIDGDKIRANASVSMIEYEQSVLRLMQKNPGTFIKTRLQAFCYACENHFAFYGNLEDENGNWVPKRAIWLDLYGLETHLQWKVLSIVKRIYLNFYIIWAAFLYFLIESIKKKNVFMLTCMIEMLIYAGIVFWIAPATYFKYYWPVYMFVLLIGGTHSCMNNKERK